MVRMMSTEWIGYDMIPHLLLLLCCGCAIDLYTGPLCTSVTGDWTSPNYKCVCSKCFIDVCTAQIHITPGQLHNALKVDCPSLPLVLFPVWLQHLETSLIGLVRGGCCLLSPS